MKLGTVPVARAIGTILAQTKRAGGAVLKKGTLLDHGALAALHAADEQDVLVITLEDGDVHEDVAAAEIARRLAGSGVDLRAAHAGRVDLLAAVDGLATIDAGAVLAANLLDEQITVATLPPDTPVAAGARIATIKIIPLALPGALLARAQANLHQAVAVHPFRPRTARLILTRLPETKASVLRKTEATMAARCAALQIDLGPTAIVAHTADAVAGALARTPPGTGLLLLSGAVQTVDRSDVLPAALCAAGGTIERFGMPVEPGNLLLLGRLGEAVVIGLPGCARSPARNGIDLVLQRIAADLPVDSAYIAHIGVGGLLAGIAEEIE